MKFLLDKEINLNEQDHLHTLSYASTIKQVILNSPENESFCIGLFGEWGSGKSSIIKTVKDELEGDKTKKIKFIIYDSWKYANDSFRRMFLLKMKEDLNLKGKDKFQQFYTNTNKDLKYESKPNWIYIGITLGLLLLGLLINSQLKDQDSKITTAIIIAFLAILVNVLGKAFYEYKVSVSEPMLFAPEQFEECFSEMASSALKKKTGFKELISIWFSTNPEVTNLDKLIIVIDNIDRTQKELAYELLTNTKNFLGKIPNIIFLIPVDDASLKKHVLNSTNSDSREAEEFLRKFFNVTFRIKQFRPLEIFDFTNKLITDNNLYFSNTTIDIISKEYATNPRRIIQFINNLTTELEYLSGKFGDSFTKNFESQICATLIIKEEWPNYYKSIASNPFLLLTPDDKVKSKINESEDLLIFLQKVKNIIKDVEPETLFKIISNTDSVSNLGEDIVRGIESGEVAKVIEFIASGQLKQFDFENYIIEKLGKSLDRNLYQTEVISIFELIVKTNEQKKFEKPFNIRVSQLIETELPNFFEHTEESDLIVKYANDCVSQNLNYLDDYLKSYINKSFESKKDSYSEFERSVLKSFLSGNDDESKIGKFKTQFANDYISSEDSLKEYELSDDKYKKLITDEINDSIIENMTDFEDGDDEKLGELIFSCDKVKLSKTSFKKLFAKLNELYTAFKNVTKEDMLILIDNLNNILSKQNKNLINKEDITDVEAFYKAIFANRSGSIYNQSTLIDEITSEKEASSLLRFTTNIFKCCYSLIDTREEINKILEKDQTFRNIFDEICLELRKNYSYTLSAYYDIILQGTNYTSNYLSVLKEIFTVKNKEKYVLDIDKLEAKLSEILEHINNSSSEITDILVMLEDLIEDERVKNVLIKLIPDLDNDHILILSEKLQQLAFDEIAKGDKIFEFENNIGFLQAIGENGKKSHIEKLVKVINAKLQREELISDGLDILESVKFLNNRDKATITNFLEPISEKHDYKERAINLMKKISSL